MSILPSWKVTPVPRHVSRCLNCPRLAGSAVSSLELRCSSWRDKAWPGNWCLVIYLFLFKENWRKSYKIGENLKIGGNLDLPVFSRTKIRFCWGKILGKNGETLGKMLRKMVSDNFCLRCTLSVWLISYFLKSYVSNCWLTISTATCFNSKLPSLGTQFSHQSTLCSANPFSLLSLLNLKFPHPLVTFPS